MSGPAIHYMAGEQLADYFQGHGNAYLEAAQGMREHTPFRNLGTMGADFLFFNPRDMPPGMAQVMNGYLEVAKFIREFKELLVGLIPEPLIEAHEAAVGALEHSVAYDELMDTVGDFRELASAAGALLKDMAIKYAVGGRDIFSLMSHPIQDGEPRKDWWWFDTLHYRRTGRFAACLLDKTRERPGSAGHAYALGYLSHMACDGVGHPYVNYICGGPYRNHSQRHKVAESFQDVFAYHRRTGREFVNSKLHTKFTFDSELPGELARLISDCAKEVYGDDYGPSLRPEDVGKAYTLWYMWFESTTESGTPPPPVPYSLSAEVGEAWNQFVDNVHGVREIVEDIARAGGGGFLGFFSALVAAIVGAVMLAVAAADFVFGMAATLTTAQFRFFVSLIYNNLYDAFAKFRLAVALNGLAYPLVEHLDKPQILHLTDPEVADSMGNFATPRDFPKLRFTQFDEESHLVHPLSPVERVRTTPCPKSYHFRGPQFYIDGSVSYEQAVFDRIKGLDVADLEKFHEEMQKDRLGNAVECTFRLYERFLGGRPIPCIGMDADRGIGYPCWKTPDEGPIRGDAVELEFTND